MAARNAVLVRESEPAPGVRLLTLPNWRPDAGVIIGTAGTTTRSYENIFEQIVRFHRCPLRVIEIAAG